MPRRVPYRRVGAELYYKEKAVAQSLSIISNEHQSLETTAIETSGDLWFCR